MNILVTGAAGGIGSRLVDLLAARGDHVLATDRADRSLAALARERAWPEERVGLAALDVCDPGDWERAAEETLRRFGSLDVLINAAGYLNPGWVRDLEPGDVRRHLGVNVEGAVFGTRAAARRMAAQGRGHILHIASLAALAPVPGLALYSASKYALRAFALAAAHELRPLGISVTVLSPDAVRTPMLELQLDRPEAALTFSGTALSADDVGRAVLDVLERRPLELFLPASRGWLARLVDVFPGLGFTLAPLLRRRGLERQRILQSAGR